MKVRLKIELVNYRNPESREAGSETYVSLEKSMELPFTPVADQNILLEHIKSDDPNSEEYRLVLEQSEEIANSTFKFESVTYVVRRDEFHVGLNTSYDPFMDEYQFNLFVKQLNLGYGFRIMD